ncbi:MAG: hypothetical protein BWK79_07025 [Beggiatoa sp. IS2]|nr:MAG: hypothetical protein BWK79_07025 [Beggiatoa sp. IS2]
MNSIRSNILQNIRQALASRKTATTRLAPIHEQPTISEEPVVRFQQQLEKVSGTLTTVSSMAKVPTTVMDFLQQRKLPFSVVMDTHLKTLPWPSDLTIAYRTATAKDGVSVSQAVMGIAETGSVVLLSGPENPTTLNFLPEIQIVILPQERLVLRLEEVWSRLQQEFSILPRAVHLITGPSRTADIEQTIQLGAHGPRILQIILITT